jgi:hypothetical protein
MNNGQPVPMEVSYRLPCTTLRVGGTREKRTEWEAAEPHVVASAAISLAVDAERRGLVRLPQFERDHHFEIKLTPDGRLAGASNDSNGLLGEAIEATLGVVSFAAGLVGSVVSPGLPQIPAVRSATPVPRGLDKVAPEAEERAEPKTPAEKWLAENPDGDAGRLKQAVQTLRDLNSAVIAIAGQAAETESPAGVYRKLITVRAAIAEVQAQIAEINARRDAWYSSHYVESKEHVSQLPTDEAFKFEVRELVAPSTIPADAVKQGSARARAVLEALDIAIVELRPESPRDLANTADAADQHQLDSDQRHGNLPPGIWFRIPRSALIALYVREGADAPLKLHSADWYWAVDADSQLNSFPLEAKGDLDVAATFTSEGLLQSLTMDAKGRLAELLEALKAAPGQIAGGIEQAEKVAKSWDTLRSARVDREVKALEQRKKQLEAAVAARGLEADASSVETLQQLKDRLARLQTERDIGKLESPPPPDEQAEEDAERRALARRLRTELAIEQREHALAAFREDGGADTQ